MGGTGLEVTRSLWEADLEIAGFRASTFGSLLAVRPAKQRDAVKEKQHFKHKAPGARYYI